MSLTAIIDAMIASGCTPEQIGAAVRAAEAERQIKRSKEASRKALQRAEKDAIEAATVPLCPRDNAGHGGTPEDSAGQQALKERPHTPKEISPLPSPPKGGSVSAPAGGSKTGRGHRLPDDWEPDSSDFDYGRKLGLSRTEIESSLEDLRQWAWSNTGVKVRKLDWHLTLKGFLKRDAGKKNARAGPRQPFVDGRTQVSNQLDEIIRESGQHHPGTNGREARPPNTGSTSLFDDSDERHRAVAGGQVLRLAGTSPYGRR